MDTDVIHAEHYLKGIKNCRTNNVALRHLWETKYDGVTSVVEVGCKQVETN